MRIILLCSILLTSFNVVADDELWEKLLKEPNMVVFLRNAESFGNKDGNNMLVWDKSGNCKGESTLTKRGKAHAKNIGKAFTKRGIKPVVISSPMCRCTETAQIAFGNYLTDPDLRQSGNTDVQSHEAFQTKAYALLNKYRGKSPVIFVNHRPNIDTLTMELINIGDLLVGTISETSEIEILGKIRVEP